MEGETLIRVLVARRQHTDVVHGIAGVGGGQLQQDAATVDVVKLYHDTPWKKKVCVGGGGEVNDPDKNDKWERLGA